MAMGVVTHNPDLAALMARRATLVDGRLTATA
jgi:ABC-type lipoprotein export system ATPase subunit